MLVTRVAPLQATHAPSELFQILFTPAEPPAQVPDFFFQLSRRRPPATVSRAMVVCSLLILARRQGSGTQVQEIGPGV